MNTDKMTDREFAAWLHSESWRANGALLFETAIASRDAYREQQALEAAAHRVREMPREKRASWACLEDAILGKPAFAQGQLVRWSAKDGTHLIFPYKDGYHRGRVEAVLDINGDPVYLPVEEATR